MSPHRIASRRRDRRHQRGRACAAVASLLVVSSLLACRAGEDRSEARIATVEARSVDRIVVATGTVEPEGEVAVRPRIAGIVEKILVEAGDEVERGQILVEIEKELIEAEVAEARASIRAAEVELRYSKIAVDRALRLQREGATSESRHDEAAAAHEGALARLAAAQAALETLDVRLRHTTVRAPRAGRVLDVPIEEGAAVSPVTSVTGGTTLLHLAETDRLHLKGNVDENEIARLAIGQPARIRTEAFGDRAFEAHVREIAPMGNRIQNVTYFEVEVEITDEMRHLLRPRMSGDAEIIAESIDDALVVPETALRYSGKDIYVDLVTGDEDDPRPERRNVVVGVVDGEYVQISSGLKLGDRVLLQ